MRGESAGMPSLCLECSRCVISLCPMLGVGRAFPSPDKGPLTELCRQLLFKDLGLHCFLLPQEKDRRSRLFLSPHAFFLLLSEACVPGPTETCVPPSEKPDLGHRGKTQFSSVRRKSTLGGCIDTHSKYSRNS